MAVSKELRDNYINSYPEYSEHEMYALYRRVEEQGPENLDYNTYTHLILAYFGKILHSGNKQLIDEAIDTYIAYFESKGTVEHRKLAIKKLIELYKKLK